MCRSGGVANITYAVEWYHPIYGTPNVAAMIHRHKTLQIQPVQTKRNHPPICHSEGAQRVEESSRVADFILWWLLLQLGWIPPLR